MQTLTDIKRLLEERGLSPRRALGQNFLVDQNLLRRLVEASGVGPGSLVLEVGPGTGTLTEELLARGCEVVACELDRGLAEYLRERFAAAMVYESPAGRLTLVEGDCLESKRRLNREVAGALGARPFRLVANLPYGAATPLLTTLLMHHPECGAMYITVQREAADRLTAAPGSKDYGPLSVVAGAAAVVRRLAVLPPECFWPRPEVTSAMVALERRRLPLAADLEALSSLCQRVFGQRRKQLGSILGRDRAFPEGIRADQRAEELTVQQLVALSQTVDSR